MRIINLCWSHGGVLVFEYMKRIYKLLMLFVALFLVYIWKWSIVVFVISFCMMRFAKKKIKRLQEQFPNWKTFNHNLQRNYDFAVIGNTIAYNCNEKIPTKNHLCWALPDQQYFMQKEVLKHFFSIIKTKGCVYLVTSQDELIRKDERKTLNFHFTVLHPWLYPDTCYIRNKVAYTWLFSPLWFLKVLHVKSFTKRNLEKCDIDANLDSIKVIGDFCKDRDLTFILVLVGNFTEEVICEIVDRNINNISYEDWVQCIKKQECI